MARQLPETVDISISLYKSMQGKYFLGYADNLIFGGGLGAWAALYNPPNSGIHLHVNVWTVSDIVTSPIRAQIWFNSKPPGNPTLSQLVTTSNLAITPTPVPKVQLMQASDVSGVPSGGIKAFSRRVPPETTLASEEDGKFIFPPEGLFLIFLSNPETPQMRASGRVAFGWWEEII